MEMFQQLFAVAGVLGALCIVVWAMKRKGVARINFFGPGGSLRGARGDSGGEVLAELRRFYRLTNARKMAHIERS